jgi:glycine/D-amino acid oxidase-like deaminating enzyme
MQIAIVGTGVAGLSVAYHLHCQGLDVTLFDPKGIGGGASGISTGLLHPFPGRQALRSWMASEGMAASAKLLEIAAGALGRPVAESTGVLRSAVTEQQKNDYQKRSLEDPEAVWLEAEQMWSRIPHAAPGLWIPSGKTVYSRRYLEGLFLACPGIKLEKTAVRSLQELAGFDRIILATGFETLQFPECAHLPLEPTKGHTLVCRWPERLPCSLVSLGHITPTEDPTLCQIGSTYEHNFRSLEPDPKAIPLLLQKAARFYPPAKDFEVVELRAGVRISPKVGYHPLVMQLSPKVWLFTGLGSRGLLYHALLGEQLAYKIAKE